MLDLCLVFLVLLLKKAAGEDPSQVWFMATKLLNILLSVVMILVIYGKKEAFMLKPEELCMYWCL